jgi:hypothetical protein
MPDRELPVGKWGIVTSQPGPVPRSRTVGRCRRPSADGFFFALAEEALEAAGLKERGEASEHAGLGGRRSAGHFS